MNIIISLIDTKTVNSFYTYAPASLNIIKYFENPHFVRFIMKIFFYFTFFDVNNADILIGLRPTNHWV